MFKVYVILVGLIGVIPGSDGKSITAILLKTDGQQTAMGKPITPHEAKVRFRSASSGISVTRPLTGDLTFEPIGPQADFNVNLNDNHRFPRLGKLLHHSVVVRSGCTGGNPATDCKHNNLPLVAARVRLTGGWTLRPLEVESGRTCGDEPILRPLARDRSVWGFRPANAEDKEHGREGEFTNGFMFEIWLPNLASLRVIGGLDVMKNQEGDCTSLDPSAPNCAFIVVRNFGECDPSPMPPHDDSDDTHFELLYALLDPVPTAEQRFIPIRQTKHIPRASQGPGQPPGSKCFGGLMQ
jgi:hypothetical protein